MPSQELQENNLQRCQQRNLSRTFTTPAYPLPTISGIKTNPPLSTACRFWPRPDDRLMESGRDGIHSTIQKISSGIYLVLMASMCAIEHHQQT
jgi:hypothetical protein